MLAAFEPDWAGCVVADLRLPGLSGIELQARVRERGSAILRHHHRARRRAAARAAFRAQAVDFIEKPFEDTQLREAIDTAFALETDRLGAAELRRADEAKLARLTPREREVLEHAVNGLHAKEIGAALGISPRTVEVHKMRIMEKLEVRNIAELVRLRFR